MANPLLLYRNEHFNANFYHHSGVDIDHSFFILEGGKQTLLVPRMNSRAAKVQFRGKVVAYEDPLHELKKLLKGKRVGVDGASIGFALAERLRKFCQPENVSEHLMMRRLVKTEDEVSKIRKAVEITKDILHSLDIRKGRTEAEIKRQLLVETLDRGLDPAFKPIVAADRNSSYPHYKTGKAKIEEMVLVDFGVRYESYSADVTRCFFLGGGKKKVVYTQLKGIFDRITERLPEFENGSELARYTASLFRKEGLPELPHSIGHGIGLEVHEFPRMGLKSGDRLAGAAFAIEPSAYFEDFGCRYEDDVYFDGKKAIVL
jgi:Xaa-Pro aminopeptidase